MILLTKFILAICLVAINKQSLKTRYKLLVVAKPERCFLNYFCVADFLVTYSQRGLEGAAL